MSVACSRRASNMATEKQRLFEYYQTEAERVVRR